MKKSIIKNDKAETVGLVYRDGYKIADIVKQTVLSRVTIYRVLNDLKINLNKKIKVIKYDFYFFYYIGTNLLKLIYFFNIEINPTIINKIAELIASILLGEAIKMPIAKNMKTDVGGILTLFKGFTHPI